MAKLQFTISEDKFDRDIDAFCDELGWSEKDGDKKEFVENKLKQSFKEIAKANRLKKALALVLVED